jgi:hypothetical protein
MSETSVRLAAAEAALLVVTQAARSAMAGLAATVLGACLVAPVHARRLRHSLADITGLAAPVLRLVRPVRRLAVSMGPMPVSAMAVRAPLEPPPSVPRATLAAAAPRASATQEHPLALATAAPLAMHLPA